MPFPEKIVLATGNAGKVAEFTSMLAPFDCEIVAQKSLGVGDVPETGTTFVENAIIKARHAAKQTGLPAIADDSGLVVDALGGAPGIYSARYSGDEASDASNIQKLLAELHGQQNRTAHFFCTLVFIRHVNDPVPLISQGRWDGTILHNLSGEGGFGYDPVFYVPALGTSAAQMTKEQKNRVNHRGSALKMLMADLREQFA